MKTSARAMSLLMAILCMIGCLTACNNLSSSMCNHKAGEWIVEKEATINAVGMKHLLCSSCGENIKSETIPQVICVHADTSWIIDTEATLYSEGKKHLRCETCGETLENEIIPELNLTENEIISKLKPAVVKVICYDCDGETEISQGSGFFIDNDGTFITNAHVVKDCFFVKINTYLGATYDVDVMYEYNDTVSDYAICKAKNCYSNNTVEFTTKASVGDTVYALSYPNDAYTMRTTSGKITSTDAVDGTKHYYSNTAWIDHGSSGGVLADAKGRVLGITTGVFADGEYAALKYQDFQYDAERVHVGSKAPLEYFHTVDEVALALYNIDDYFDVFVEANAISDTNVTYWVTVRLKDRYRTAKILLDSMSVSVTVTIKTEFEYQEIAYYGPHTKTERKTEYLYFNFYNEDDLVSGDQQNASSSIYIGYTKDYYGMDISYEVDFFGGYGTIIIFDKGR